MYNDCFRFSVHSFHIRNFPIPSVTHQTGGLSINCIYVLSAYPILTFFMPPVSIICGVVFGVNTFIVCCQIIVLVKFSNSVVGITKPPVVLHIYKLIRFSNLSSDHRCNCRRSLASVSIFLIKKSSLIFIRANFLKHNVYCG